jgi:putative peptide zinc metalloprotease protein
MTATAEPPAATVEAPVSAPLALAQSVELLGNVHGSGYKEGAALVRRGDGQMVQLGPLMYGLLAVINGRRDNAELAAELSSRLGRRLEAGHVERIALKLAAQGLLAGSEHRAPPRRNPLLALRWKVLVTNPVLTRRLTAPFTILFRPWVVAPVLACFCAVFWFVLFHKGVASATAQAFHDPGLLLLVFVLAVASAGFHELGHAAAGRYGGATPGGMGMGLYLVWPAFYTDVTDSYRLPRRDRLRVDLGGLYFNAVVAVVTMAVWLAARADALLLLVALQVLQMVKQLSPVIRADGYHILSDATGIPDLFSHMGPTLRRLLPGRREPSALTGRARLIVTLWVLIVVPVLASLSFSAVLLLPKLVTTAWDSGRHIAVAVPHQLGHGQILDLLAALVRLLALALPVLGSALVTQKIVRTTGTKAWAWSDGQTWRRAVVAVAGTAIVAGMVWAWWPDGQYQPVRANQGGTIAAMGRMIAAPQVVARPAAAPVAELTPGAHLAMAMIPVGGASKRHPALFIVSGGKGKPAVALVSDSTPAPRGVPRLRSAATPGAPTTTARPSAASTPTASAATATGSSPAGSSTTTVPAAAFPFQLPAAPGPGGTQAVAVNTKDGGVTYDVAYSLVTVRNGAPVTNTNSAYALANCKACTTVAVSFQLVLIIGESKSIAPINAAGALNYDCPACTTTAIADQIVVTLSAQPSQALLAELTADLKQLNALPELGTGGTPTAVATEVAAVQKEIETQLNQSGLPAQPIGQTPTTTSTSSATPTSTATTPTTASGTPTTASGAAASPSTTTPASSSAGSGPAGSSPTSTTSSTSQSTTPAPQSSSPSTTTTSSTPSSTTSTSTTSRTTTTGLGAATTSSGAATTSSGSTTTSSATPTSGAG